MFIGICILEYIEIMEFLESSKVSKYLTSQNKKQHTNLLRVHHHITNHHNLVNLGGWECVMLASKM
jgi:hypothetical protein